MAGITADSPEGKALNAAYDAWVASEAGKASLKKLNEDKKLDSGAAFNAFAEWVVKEPAAKDHPKAVDQIKKEATDHAASNFLAEKTKATAEAAGKESGLSIGKILSYLGGGAAGFFGGSAIADAFGAKEGSMWKWIIGIVTAIGTALVGGAVHSAVTGDGKKDEKNADIKNEKFNNDIEKKRKEMLGSLTDPSKTKDIAVVEDGNKVALVYADRTGALPFTNTFIGTLKGNEVEFTHIRKLKSDRTIEYIELKNRPKIAMKKADGSNDMTLLQTTLDDSLLPQTEEIKKKLATGEELVDTRTPIVPKNLPMNPDLIAGQGATAL